MKKLILTVSALCVLCACASVITNTDYIPMGPDGLSVQILDASKMPVFTYLKDIKEPWAPIGMYRIKALPDDDVVLKAEILKIKKAAAAKGANAIILNQFYDDAAAEDGHPITLAAYFVKYAREVTEEDKVKIEEYAEIERLRNARN